MKVSQIGRFWLNSSIINYRTDWYKNCMYVFSTFCIAFPDDILACDSKVNPVCQVALSMCDRVIVIYT